ncbi:MAG: hypothetical protein AB1489_33245 [Acidobacteriota bacterium]
MGWVNDVLKGLKEGKKVTVRPFGGSMKGKIESGQLVTLVPINFIDIKVEDIVLVKWKGNYILHLIKEIDNGKFLIGNNLGKVNGWVDGKDILAKVIEVTDYKNYSA